MSDRKSLASLQIKSDLFKDVKYYGSGIIDKEVSTGGQHRWNDAFSHALFFPSFRFSTFWREAAPRAARSCSRT